MKRYDLMNQINARGTFCVSRACLPHLLKSDHAHILTLSPPLNMETRWFENHVAYSMAKYGMSMCTLGMAGEFKGKVAVNSLWPRTAIWTAAMMQIGPMIKQENCRKPAIMADAAHAILCRDPKDSANTGNFYIDDEVLAEAGITDLEPYAEVPGGELLPDFFI